MQAPRVWQTPPFHRLGKWERGFETGTIPCTQRHGLYSTCVIVGRETLATALYFDDAAVQNLLLGMGSPRMVEFDDPTALDCTDVLLKHQLT